MDEDEFNDVIEVKEEAVEIDPFIQEVVEKPSFIGPSKMCPGCGPLLGLKIALQVLGKRILVGSYGCAEKLANSLDVPFIALPDAASAASIISNYEDVLVYSGDGSTREFLQSVISAAENNKNIIYICHNDQGRCGINKPSFEFPIAKSIPGNYCATASVSEPSDYIRKLKRCSEVSGFRFIEVLTPCPDLWKFDASNTIEVARLAVETGLWPLYEVEHGRLKLKKLSRFEPVERYLELSGLSFSNEDLEKINSSIKRKWKMIK